MGSVSRSSVSNDIETIQKFTGKELDDEHGVGLYYFGARYYDPVIGRFTSVDPLEQYNSPFLYCGNNPLNCLDPDGEFAFFIPLIPPVIAYVAAITTSPDLQTDLLDITSTFTDPSASTSDKVLSVTGAAIPGLGSVQLKTGEKAVSKVINSLKAMDRGRANEIKALNDLNLVKNTKKIFSTEGNSIPDAITDTAIYEIKDTKRVVYTPQIKVQKHVTKKESKKYFIVTGTYTKVSKKVKEESEIIRLDYLGPQKE